MNTQQKIIFTLCTTLGLWLTSEALVSRLYKAELDAWESPPPSKIDGAPTLKGNPYLLFEFAPGVRNEQGVTVTINSMGMRGEDIDIPKPQGIKRFITTGDSSVFGFGVEDSEVFSQVAATNLGEDVEGLCAAVPGYSSYQSINFLRLRGLKTEPDLFVVANIWSDNNFDSFVDKDLLATTMGFEESWVGKMQRTFSNSAIFRVADWKLRVRKQQEKIRTVSWQVGSSNHVGARRVEINDYVNNLMTLVNMAKERDAEIVFVMLANEDDLNLEKNEGKAWTPYRKAMKLVAETQGAPLINVPKLFIESGLPKQDLFLDEMHPTAKGHAIMGDALAQLLSDADWVGGGSIMTNGTGKSIPTQQDPFVKGSISQAVTGLNGGSPVKISGTVQFSGYESGIIHLDAITAQTRNPEVVNAIQLNQPGPFALPVGLPKKVTLRAYIDPEGDGPDADDVRIDLSDTIFHLDQRAANNIIVNLDTKSIQLP